MVVEGSIVQLLSTSKEPTQYLKVVESSRGASVVINYEAV
jgi:hypothetical protein